ncbi:hypothetical protein CJJ07_000783 [Candidozyma auris]|nr:hypothetical protein CJJ07_000783 [[Candida] auris]
MTFPLETSNLVAYLRAFSVATADPDSNDAARIIKPLQFGLYKEELNKYYLGNLRCESPPIPYDLRSQGPSSSLEASESKRAAVKSKKRNHMTGNARRERNNTAISALKDTQEELSDSSVRTLDASQIMSASIPHSSYPSAVESKKSQKTKKKNPLVKLFQKSDKSSFSSSFGFSTNHSIKSSITENSFEPESERIEESPPEMRTFTIDSATTFEKNALPDSSRTSTMQESLPGKPSGHVPSISASEGVAETETSSTDSAFTDIEGDSLMDVEPDLIYDYSVPDSYVLHEDKTRKRTEQKMKGNHSSASLFSSANKSSVDDSEEKSDKASIRKQENTLRFEKMYYAVGNKEKEQASSNLSRMIQSKFRSTFINPLNYFGFVGSEAPVPNAHKVYIDFFMPPKDTPTIKKLAVWNSSTVMECIGYVLLQLSNLAEYADNLDKDFINPNNWRMELIDEDGELYDGNFGVLDRTRQLSSYNSPNCLALCKVNNSTELKHNEKQTPLPPDFKQNLETFQKKPEDTIQDDHSFTPQFDTRPNQMGVDTIEVKVDNIPDSHTNIVSFFISTHMTVGELLDLICQQYHIDPSRYRLAEADFPDKTSSMLGDDIKRPSKSTYQKPLENSALLSALPTKKFKFVPNLAQTIRPLTDVSMGSQGTSGITPSSSTYIPHGITPPLSQLNGVANEISAEEKLKMPDTRSEKLESKKASKSDLDVTAITKRANNLTFGDILNQNRPSLPVSLNTIYFKWTVYRRKPPLLNKIEKALIIDGDYIHLAPTDDVNWRNNPADNPLSTSNVGSHHHYLHHYNYSKFYKETMMKTSSFHITQIVKLKKYSHSKNPNHFKIVIEKPVNDAAKETAVKKKYDLEAETGAQCDEILEKIRWALQVYNNMMDK